MTKVVQKKALRCAIYTRVSTDAGLEQDFNSLDERPRIEPVSAECEPCLHDLASPNAGNGLVEVETKGASTWMMGLLPTP